MFKNCTPLWREAHFEVKMYKTRQLRPTFKSYNVEKLHAAVARSTCPSQNVKKTDGLGALFEVPMSKNCTPLWREAHFEVKMYKTLHVRTTFWSSDVEKLHAAVARSTLWSENAKKLTFSDHFLKLRCSRIARRCGEKHILKSKCTKHVSFGPLLKVTMSKNCTPLWREAHVQVKMLRNWRSRSTFWSYELWREAPMSKNCTPLWREAHL